ncbi:SDR family oxidoreductase [Streptomyces sp. NPDC001984]
MADLRGKTALVTGGSRGIGRAIAQRLAADGARVAVHYARQDADALETVSAIEEAGGRAFPLKAELGTDGDVDTLFARLAEGLAGERLDVLVNNAAILAGGTLEQTTPEDFDRIFAVNVRAPFFIVQRALSVLRDGGRIINVSSAATRIAMPELVYAMTKGAIDVMGRSLAMQLGPRGITVNTVAPGVTATDMNARMRDKPEMVGDITAVTALGRIGEPADIADIVDFLASDDARWVTGHVLDATGGLFLGPPGFRPH